MSFLLVRIAAAIVVSALVPLSAAHAGPVFAEGAEAEKLFGGASGAEGPAPHPNGSVYFVDVTTTLGQKEKEFGRLWRHDIGSGETTLFLPHAGQPNGMTVARNGDLVVAQAADWGGRRIVRVDPETMKTTLVAGLFEGAPFNAPNDIAADGAGRFYFTDPRYLGHEPIEQDAFGVYRIDPDGKVARVIEDLQGPNGIAIHPDGRTLYVAEYDVGFHDLSRYADGKPWPEKGDMKLMAYDLDADGRVANPRVVVDFGDGYGMDGLTVDAAGRIFGAVRDDARYGVRVYSPDGEEIDYLSLPEKPSNVAFGVVQSDRDVIYITTRTSLYRARFKPAKD